MKIVVTGGTGFVGSHLCGFFHDQGHAVTAIGSRAVEQRPAHPPYADLVADTTRPGQWQEAVAQADAVVNLAGKSIFQRWTAKHKQQMRDSRILTTRHVAAALRSTPPAVLLSTSAVGYYGSRGEDELTETSSRGNDFLADLARDWEAEALSASGRARIVLMRFGIVLGTGGGALASMLPAFRSYTGGPLGSGKQWFPWIHIADLAAACRHLLAQPELEGPFNLCSPNPVRNAEMAQALGRALNRPAKVRVPRFVLKTMMGELADALLSSQRALPARLLASGFQFFYPRLEAALRDLVPSTGN